MMIKLFNARVTLIAVDRRLVGAARATAGVCRARRLKVIAREAKLKRYQVGAVAGEDQLRPVNMLARIGRAIRQLEWRLLWDDAWVHKRRMHYHPDQGQPEEGVNEQVKEFIPPLFIQDKSSKCDEIYYVCEYYRHHHISLFVSDDYGAVEEELMLSEVHLPVFLG